MKRIVAFILAFISLPALQGCSFPEAFEIEQTQRVLVAGLDVENGEIVLTAMADTTEGSEPEQEKVSFRLYTARGETVSEAENMLGALTDKHITWHHTKYIIIGEDAAKEGIARLFSFFTEDDEARLLYRIAVAKESTAKDFLLKANTIKGGLGGYLDALFSGAGRTGFTREIHLLNYAAYSEIPWVSVYIPTVEVFENPVGKGGAESGDEGGNEGESEQEFMIKAQGFALFDGDKLAGYLDARSARALNFLTGDVNRSLISVKDEKGKAAALDLIGAHTKVTPSFDPLFVEIEVDLQSNLTEYKGIDPMEADDLQYLAQRHSEIIRDEMAEAVSQMQSMACDPAFIMDRFYHKDPVKWQELKDDWKDVFTKLKVKIKVSTTIHSTYEFAQTAGEEGG